MIRLIGYAFTMIAAKILYTTLGCNVCDWRYWAIALLFLFGGIFTFGGREC